MMFYTDEAAIHFNTGIVHYLLYVATDEGLSTLPLNSYHILLRLMLINCQKRAVNSLFETTISS